MSHPTKVRWAGAHRVITTLLLLALALPLASVTALGQEKYVSRYDLFAGYTFLDSPHVGLFENGFHFQAGVRPKTWYSLGFDYSVSSGSLTLTPNLLTPDLQRTLGAQLAALVAQGIIPATYTLVVPSDSLTQTVTGGPQLAYRHFSKITLFVRPSVGAIHEVATPQPAAGDPVAKGIVAQLAPGGKKTDWTIFYGFGGGTDFLFSKHVALRVQADLVYDHLFNDLLQDGRFTVRFSVGPCFNFGKNIAKRGQ
ncbi:MAG: hypothetical protein ABSF45_21090 [Terriglobia bacterium]|jgi:hypothetical protein